MYYLFCTFFTKNHENRQAIKITLLLASSLTVMSGALIAPALPRMAEVFAGVPHAAFLTKLILTIPAIFIAVLSPVAGWLVDRFGKMRLFVVSMLLYAVAGGAGFVLSDLYHILISRAVLGIAVAGIMTTATTLIGDYFAGDERKQFLGTQAAFMAFGGTVFVTLSGWLADIGWRFPFLVYLFSLVVLVLVQKYLHEPQISQDNAPQSSTGARNKRWIGIMYAATFFGMMMFYMIPVQSPFLLKQMGAGSNFIGGLGVMVATLFAALAGQNYGRLKRRLSFVSIYFLTFGLMAAGYAVVYIATDIWLVIVGMVLAGTGAGWLMPNANLCLIEIVPPHSRGKVIGGLTSAVFAGQFLSPIAIQPVVDATSLNIAYGVAAVLLVVVALTFLAGKSIPQRKPATV